MKKLLVIACLLLALLLAVTACTQDPPAEQPTDTSETVTGTPTEPEETQPEDSKPEETQPEETKPEETKPQETEPQETKPQETQPQETKPQETEPQETEPEIIENTDIHFFTEVENEDVGTAIDYTDMFNLFDMSLPQGNCGVEMFNGQKVYAMRLINNLYYTNDGFYYFKTNNVQTTPASDGNLKSYMLIRAYQRVNSDWLIQNEDTGAAQLISIKQFYENDGAGHTGGAGIYAAIMDGNLHLILKYYDDTANRRIGNKLYTVPCEGTELTMADDGSTVYVLVGDKLLATIALSGSITYEDIKAENCSPGNTFAASATIKLADGTEETIENTLIADTPLSQIGISNRGNAQAGSFLFSYLEYGPFSEISIPEMDVTTPPETEPQETEPQETEPQETEPQETEPQETEPEPEPIVIPDTTGSFTSNVNGYENGTTFDQTDLPNFFEMKLAQGGCVIEELNGQKVYGMHLINAIAHTNDGLYYFKLDNARTTLAADGKLKSYMIVRGYQKVISDASLSSNTRIQSFYENDGASHTGGAGIYAAVMDGNLHIILKYYNASVERRVGNKLYTIPCEGTALTMADDGSTVYILVGDKLMATVALSGSITYADIKAENCSPRNTFAASATIKLANGKEETIENTLIADTPLSQIGISNRGNATAAIFLFSSLEYGAFSKITIPEFVFCEHNWVDATCTEPKFCTICQVTEGEALGHSYVEGTCSRYGGKDPNYGIPDTNVSFVSDVSKYDAGTTLDQTDLANLFEMKLAQGGCVIEELNGEKVYAMHMINAMIHTNDGLYYFKTNNVQSSLGADHNLKSYMIVRGYWKVGSKVTSFYASDNAGHTGGAGIYAAILDGQLNIIVKYYDSGVSTRVGNKLYTMACTGTELTMADDGSTVYIMVDGKLMATITLSGRVTYADFTTENCTPGNTFAASAKVILADGTEEIIENTLVADTPLSQIGLSNRGNATAATFLFSSLEYGAFSAITIPEMNGAE